MEPALRPFVWVNCATSLDGRLSLRDGRRAVLSGAEDLVRVQRLRRSLDGLAVGVRTVVLDDPSLRVHRELLPEAERPHGKDPLRIVLDSRGRTPRTARVLQPPPPTALLGATARPSDLPGHVQWAHVGDGRVDLGRALDWLGAQGVRSLLVEGGGEVIASFLQGGHVDRMTVYTAPVYVGGPTTPGLNAGAAAERDDDRVTLRLASVERLGEGHLATWAPGGPARRPVPEIR